MTAPSRTLRLGLIGGNIAATRSPALHIVAGLSVGLNVTYDLIVPEELRLPFPEVIAHCARHGFDGVNVTYPYKEEAAALVKPGNPVVAAMGSANTIRFTGDGPRAYNTDHSGFIAAWRAEFGDSAPGRVLLLGAGGAGRAVGFGLADLGAAEIVLHDTDPARAASLLAALGAHRRTRASPLADTASLTDLDGFDGVVNCTPLGMTGRPGSALPSDARGRPKWAFDAVYTPVETDFRSTVLGLGAHVLSGYELYFHQGLQAFEIFSGEAVTERSWIRSILTHAPATAAP
jgi:shikimate dehydrogenase